MLYFGNNKVDRNLKYVNTKKVIVITYYWLPTGGTAVKRWLKFGKYLPEFGWQPIIYTPEYPTIDSGEAIPLEEIRHQITVIKKPIWEPFKRFYKQEGGSIEIALKKEESADVKNKLLGWVNDTFLIPDTRKFWVRPSFKYLNNYIKERNISHIITSGPPHSLHLIGLKLKKKNPNLNWVADMRENWINSDIIPQTNAGRNVQIKQRRLEDKVLKAADKIVLRSEGQLDYFESVEKSKIEIISDGFDTADYTFKTNKKNNDFIISHIGTLNEWHDPKAFFVAVQSLASEYRLFSEKVKIRLAGEVSLEIIELVNKFSFLSNRVQFLNISDREQQFEEYSLSNLILLIPNQQQNSLSEIPDEIFEYMACQKPVFALTQENSSIAALIEKTGIGFSCNYKKVEDIKWKLAKIFDKFVNGKITSPNIEIINQYSHKNLTKKLSKLLFEMN